jgi:hypothetical protein
MRFLGLGIAALGSVVLVACAPDVEEAPSDSVTASACPVEGAWEVESVAVDGAAEPLGDRRQIKLLTGTRFAFVSQSPGPEGLSTVADSLAAYRTGFFGGGVYRVEGSTYVETVEFFGDPRYVGVEIRFTCRVEGDLWTIEGDLPTWDENGSVVWTEVSRRIE